jgi:hypothetical protein
MAIPMIEKLHRIKNIVESAIAERDMLDNINKEDLQALIDACMQLDLQYQWDCDTLDGQLNDPPGTSYVDGIDSEYMLEASYIHNVSVALRRIVR